MNNFIIKGCAHLIVCPWAQHNLATLLAILLLIPAYCGGAENEAADRPTEAVERMNKLVVRRHWSKEQYLTRESIKTLILGCIVIPRSPYSPDLAPFDCQRFLST